MLIAVLGLNGSGKDSVADRIAEKYSFKKISLSDIVREEAKSRGLDPRDRDNLNAVSEELRKKEGPDYLMKRVLKGYSGGNLVLSSFRHPSEVELVKANKGIVVKVTAGQKVRFERVSKRFKLGGAHGTDSFEDFVRKEERELKNPDPDRMQIAQCLALSDYEIDNSGSFGELYKKIDLFMESINR